MEEKLIVNISPHIRAKDTTQTIMRDVIIALIPAGVAAVIHYQVSALLVIIVCVAAAVASEAIMQKIIGKPVTVKDLSAVVTGLILAYNLPAGIPLWMAAMGSAIAIVIVKQLFGGLGQNFANPAVTARIILFISFAGAMSDWVTGYPDAFSGATPLATMGTADAPSYLDLFLGRIGGSLGETCTLALLIGFVYLLIRKVITWHATVCFVAAVFLLTLAAGQDPVYNILSGGVMLGAIFMATDYVTTPSTSLGRAIFGIGAGCITVVIRLFGSYPEGVSFAILLMNILSPHIERLTMTKPLGGETKK